MKRAYLALLLLPGLVFSAVTLADELGEVKKALTVLFPEDEPDSVTPSVIPGLYEAAYGAQLFYVTKDGRYVLEGDVLDLQQRENISESRRSAYRLRALQKVNEKDMIVFPAQETKHTLTVFTDIDCSYCRKLHQEMAELNKHGVKVRYLAFPRAGVGSPSYDKFVSVFCAKNRNEAITAAKADKPLEQKTCDNPVKQQYELAKKLGVTGTPTLVLEDGVMVPGYVPAQRLIQLLDEAGSKTGKPQA
ncbi:MAG: DsbC family protein [Pseudomonadota bacterium]